MPSGASAHPETCNAVATTASADGVSMAPTVVGSAGAAGSGATATAGAGGETAGFGARMSCRHATAAAIATAPAISAAAATR